MDNSSNTTTVSVPTRNVQEYKIVLYCILLVWSLVGNILVVAVIVYNKNLRTCFNYLVLNMTISDLLCPLVSLPIRIFDEVETWPGGSIGDGLCKFVYFLTDISPTVSIFTLVIVAFERFTAIVYSKRVRINRKRTSILIVLTWILAMAIFSPYLYGFKEINSDCKLVLEVKDIKLFYNIVIVAVFTIPFVSIIILYTAMIFKIRQASKNITNMLDSRQARSRHRRNKNIFCLSLIIVASFAVFWGPFFGVLFVISIVWQFNVPNNVDTDKIVFIVDVLGLFNSCINPCIYFSFQKQYRLGLRRIWRHVFAKRFSDSNIETIRFTTQSTYCSRHINKSTMRNQDTSSV
ncbi:neuropeptide receptor 22-like isoform X3 [Exaiptasia diaphana]|uniref:G-protein coupled receptors family 1 profile domain-containing protein n=1 Tax=Exaiptasia diaphana TaxID=2652724 RepID=A0A913YWV5_EXADI|nr:neuropeptide receptor 22-like isoform X3 [Exaiptasia diaphana]